LKRVKVYFSLIYKKKEYNGSLVFNSKRNIQEKVYPYFDFFETKEEILDIIKDKNRGFYDLRIEVKELDLYDQLFELFENTPYKNNSKKIVLKKVESFDAA
jgi:hypothetical protein